MIKNIISQHLDEDVNQKTDLCKIYAKYGSDKSTWHNYSAIYKKIFTLFENEPITFLEVGLGTNYTDIPSNMGRDGVPGASLYAVAALYPKWNVVGLDVDKRVLFQDARKNISTFYVDQTNPASINLMWTNEYFVDKKVKIIIDDGLHEFYANRCFFENSHHMLSNGGVYIIEDVLNEQLALFSNYFDNISQWGNYSYSIVQLPHPTNNRDNNLIIITNETQ